MSSRTDDLRLRLSRAAATARAQGVDVLLVSPGPDLRYLTGYDAIALERLTCLVMTAGGDPVMVVPGLEKAAAQASPIGELGLPIITWGETEDPYALVARQVPRGGVVAVDDLMHAVKAIRLRDAMSGASVGARIIAAGSVMAELRMRKTPSEVASLQAAGAAIDTVHAEVWKWLRVGRTEAQVGADIADAIRAAGHASVDFVIVGSGPNGASPHHELSDRIIESADQVVVDIGGTMPDGYCSDSTRTYSMGAAPAEFVEAYSVLQASQEAATAYVMPGVSAESVDAVARSVLSDAGLGELFIHRLGHGIGLSTHEEPYLVTGNTIPLEIGFAFSIEPGFYRAGRHGARIEDIVVCGADGAIICNNRPRELVVLEG